MFFVVVLIAQKVYQTGGRYLKRGLGPRKVEKHCSTVLPGMTDRYYTLVNMLEFISYNLQNES